MPPKNQQIARTPDQLPKPKFYLITRQQEGHGSHDGFTGNDMFVRFWEGVGVLDNFAIYLERSDWVERVGEDYLQHTGVTVDEYLAYWKTQRAFVVKEITKDEAAAFRAGVEVRKRDLDHNLAAAIRQKTKLKSEGRDEGAPNRLAQETEIIARQQAALSGDLAPKAAAPAAATESAEKLPHEQGGAMDAPEDDKKGDATS